MTLLARLRSRNLRREMDAIAADYEVAPTVERRAATQLELLNAGWRRTVEDVPYFALLAKKHALPREFGSLEEFAKRVPTTNRSTLQEHKDALLSTHRPPDVWMATGGSTSTPIQIPRWNSESVETQANIPLARRWYGVEPDDRLFLLWGHSHLLGTGLRGFVNARKRELSDRLLGYYRFSAYDISDAAMKRALEQLLAFRPDYVLGYSVALDRLECVARASSDALQRIGLKTVIGTSESFPAPDSADRIERTFGCPVAMEYGAVEALSIAHTHPGGGYRVFWRSYLAEAERSGERWLLRLTSLYPRCQPIVRYEIGDELELPAGSPDRVIGLVDFDRVVGRCNEYVEMPDGQLVHSEAFSHAVRPCDAIGGYQVVRQEQGLTLRYTGARALPADQEDGLRRRLSAVHPELVDIAIERADELERSVAGKTPMIVRR